MSEKNMKLHISDEKLSKLAFRGFEGEEDLINLEHITLCDECAKRYATYIEGNLISTPRDFKEEVLRKADKLNLTLLKNKWKFYGYCFRVGLACACSILLLITFDTEKFSNMTTMINMNQNQGITDTIQDKLESFRDYINNLEVKFNEK